MSHTFRDKVDASSCMCMTSSCLLRGRSLFMYLLIVLKQSSTGFKVGAYGGKYAKVFGVFAKTVQLQVRLATLVWPRCS